MWGRRDARDRTAKPMYPASGKQTVYVLMTDRVYVKNEVCGSLKVKLIFFAS